MGRERKETYMTQTLASMRYEVDPDIVEFDELNDDDAYYSFNKLTVFKTREGLLFWGTDHGCSCPSPYDGQTINDLHPLATQYDFDLFEKQALNRALGEGDYYRKMNTLEDVTAFVSRVRNEWRNL
jgi:hypothetical protein